MNQGHFRAIFSKPLGTFLGSIEMDGFASFRTVKTRHDQWYQKRADQ